LALKDRHRIRAIGNRETLGDCVTNPLWRKSHADGHSDRRFLWSRPTASAYCRSLLFAAISVEAFIPLVDFYERIDRYIVETSVQPRLPGVEQIYLPGELEFASARRAEAEGVVVSPAGWIELQELARRFDVASLEIRLQSALPAD
jgi:hypothetical protein